MEAQGVTLQAGVTGDSFTIRLATNCSAKVASIIQPAGRGLSRFPLGPSNRDIFPRAPSLLREGLDGKVASTGRSAESPWKALNDLLEEAIANHIWGGGSGAHLPSDPPHLPSGLAGGASQLCCQCCLLFGPEERDRRSSPLRIGFGMCLVVCVFGCELIACCWFFHGRPLRNS